MKDLLNNLPILRVGILVSGNGSNMENLIRTIHNRFINFKTLNPYDKNENLDDIDYINSRKIEIVCVVSNNEKALALSKAQALKVRTFVVNNSFFDNELDSKDELSRMILNLDILLLAGFMKILKSNFIDRLKNTKILNIHPSFLPLHKGLNAIQKSYEDSLNYGGVTVHLVDKDVDNGPIILQEKLEKIKGEDLENFTNRIHALEYMIYPRAFFKLVREIYGKA